MDVAMTVLLLFLMAYQVTGEVLHEWIGIVMTVLVVAHQILNRRWYAAIFRGKYKTDRIITTVINIALLASFALTAFCGMSMSGHAVPFLYGMTKISFARQMHLSMSHWAFVLMGLHLGMHIPAMTAKMVKQDAEEKKEKQGIAITAVFAIIAGIGLYFFIKSGMPDYLFFRVPFAFLDYEKAGVLVLLENLLMLCFWAFMGAQIAFLLRGRQKSRQLVFILLAVLIGVVLQRK